MNADDGANDFLDAKEISAPWSFTAIDLKLSLERVFSHKYYTVILNKNRSGNSEQAKRAKKEEKEMPYRAQRICCVDFIVRIPCIRMIREPNVSSSGILLTTGSTREIRCRLSRTFFSICNRAYEFVLEEEHQAAREELMKKFVSNSQEEVVGTLASKDLCCCPYDTLEYISHIGFDYPDHQGKVNATILCALVNHTGTVHLEHSLPEANREEYEISVEIMGNGERHYSLVDKRDTVGPPLSLAADDDAEEDD
jgi:hypothetical protein